MEFDDPMKKNKDQYTTTINKIASNTAVGIDPQFTHAIIIDYLQQITKRLDRLEQMVEGKT